MPCDRIQALLGVHIKPSNLVINKIDGPCSLIVISSLDCVAKQQVLDVEG